MRGPCAEDDVGAARSRLRRLLIRRRAGGADDHVGEAVAVDVPGGGDRLARHLGGSGSAAQDDAPAVEVGQGRPSPLPGKGPKTTYAAPPAVPLAFARAPGAPTMRSARPSPLTSPAAAIAVPARSPGAAPSMRSVAVGPAPVRDSAVTASVRVTSVPAGQRPRRFRRTPPTSGSRPRPRAAPTAGLDVRSWKPPCTDLTVRPRRGFDIRSITQRAAAEYGAATGGRSCRSGPRPGRGRAPAGRASAGAPGVSPRGRPTRRRAPRRARG